MIKTARKPSTDPVQEKLRQSKAVWNKEVSNFVGDLINYKKLMNGWPNKFHMEKSFIKDPIPADPATIIGSLAGDFNDIAQKGNALIKQQLDYAKSRKKRQMKQLPLPLGKPAPATPAGTPPPATPDLSQQLSLPISASLEEKYGLVAEGSNPLSRFFTKLLTPTFGVGEAARIRKYRMTLLDSCVKTFKDLGKLQVEIVKSSKGSLQSSNKILHRTWTDWMMVYRGFSTYKTNMPRDVKDSGGEISADKEILNEKDIKENSSSLVPSQEDHILPSSNEVVTEDPSSSKKSVLDIGKAVLKDYMSILNQRTLLSPRGPMFKDINSAAEKFIVNKEDIGAANVLIQAWGSLLYTFNKNFGVSATSFKDLVEIAKMRQREETSYQKEQQKQVKEQQFKEKQIKEQQDKAIATKTTTAQINVLAQDFLRKWIGKSRHELSVFDKSSAYRLDIYKMAGELRKILNKIMNSLEKDMKVDELDTLIIQVNSNITQLRGLMRALHNSEPAPPKASKMPDPDNMGAFERMNLLEKYM